MEVELYVKEHNVTGLKYFGKHKVCSTSIYDYSGSGKDWVPHLEEYGNDVTTHSVGIWDENDPELEYAALGISALFDIVNSDEWANMKPENGTDGGWEYVNSIKTSEEIAHISKMGFNAAVKTGLFPRVFTKIDQLKGGNRIKWLWENDEVWANSMRKEMINNPNLFGDGGNTPKAMKKKKATFKKNEHQQGSKNSQYGTMWITNETESKKIQKDQDIPDGWLKGRKIK